MTGPPKRKTPAATKPKMVTKLPKNKPSTAKVAAHAPKSFSVKPWTSEGEGEKLCVYGPSGIGKTTLAAMLDNNVFIGLDDGGRKIVNPLTSEPVNAVTGIRTFQDVRDALAQDSLWPEGCTITVDTATKLDEPMQQHVLDTVTIKGQRAKSFRAYGWDGDRHMLDQWRLLLTDLDRHVRMGHNVLLLCQQNQVKVANAEGADYQQDAPSIPHRADASPLEEVKQWCDHVVRIGYLDLQVAPGEGKKAGKVISTDTTRVIFTQGAQHFTAKSRPINGKHLPELVSFESEADDSLWNYIFRGGLTDVE